MDLISNIKPHNPELFSQCRTAHPLAFNTFPAPQVTASAWSIINVQTGECLWGKNKDMVRDIASLTKIMTFFVVKQCLRHKVCSDQDLATVQKEAVLLGGTTANLHLNDSIRIIDLLYAMMLPSGNDAAYTLADHCGAVLLQAIKKPNKQIPYTKIEFFVRHMNIWGKRLGLKNSKFLNPHGLSHFANQSTASDISKLAALLINQPFAHEIVSKSKYSCEVRNGLNTRKVTWQNTNLLLGKHGVVGFKTGQTPTAGPCICLTYNVSGYKLALTLLKTRTPDKRWTEAAKLIDWAIGQLDMVFQKHGDKNFRMRNLSSFLIE